MSNYPARPTPVEDVNRGTVVALLAIPAGIAAWVLVGLIGIIASFVSLGVAYLAMFLYTRGSGGLISRRGAIRITIITLVTVALSIIAGLVSDVAIISSRLTHLSPLEALSEPHFPVWFSNYLATGDWVLNVLLGIAFAILGCFGILRNAFRATATPAAPTQQQPWPQQEPPAGEAPKQP